MIFDHMIKLRDIRYLYTNKILREIPKDSLKNFSSYSEQIKK